MLIGGGSATEVDMQRAEELSRELSAKQILDGGSLGDREYALERFKKKCTNEAALLVVEIIEERVEAAKLLSLPDVPTEEAVWVANLEKIDEADVEAATKWCKEVIRIRLENCENSDAVAGIVLPMSSPDTVFDKHDIRVKTLSVNDTEKISYSRHLLINDLLVEQMKAGDEGEAFIVELLASMRDDILPETVAECSQLMKDYAKALRVASVTLCSVRDPSDADMLDVT